jgi:hypothetical protein
MSYTYRSRPSPDQQAEQRRQKLELGVRAYRKATTSICARLTAQAARGNRKSSKQIWDGMAIRAVTVAAAITAAEARSIGLAFKDIGPRYSSAASRLETLSALAQRIGRLSGQEELRGQQEELILTALETTGLDVAWLAAITGLNIERVNILAQQKRRHATILERSWAPEC